MNTDEVRRIAHLSRIELTEEECRTLQRQFESILGHIRKIDELDLKDTEPVSHPFNIKNVFREDVLKQDPEVARRLLKIAPAASREMVQVPPVIETKG